MSFNFQDSGTREELAHKVQQDPALPQSVKDFILRAVDVLKADKMSVRAYGHLHDGSDGNYNVSTANLDIRPA